MTMRWPANQAQAVAQTPQNGLQAPHNSFQVPHNGFQVPHKGFQAPLPGVQHPPTETVGPYANGWGAAEPTMTFSADDLREARALWFETATLAIPNRGRGVWALLEHECAATWDTNEVVRNEYLRKVADAKVSRQTGVNPRGPPGNTGRSKSGFDPPQAANQQLPLQQGGLGIAPRPGVLSALETTLARPTPGMAFGGT